MAIANPAAESYVRNHEPMDPSPAIAILKKIVEPADKHQRPNPELMKARNHFLREVSVIMATSSAHMICFARTQMRQDGTRRMEVLPKRTERMQRTELSTTGEEISQEVDEFMGGLQLPSTSREAMVEANPPRG
jgi:hypothetical protein